MRFEQLLLDELELLSESLLLLELELELSLYLRLRGFFFGGRVFFFL